MGSPIEEAMYKALISFIPNGRHVWSHDPNAFMYRASMMDIAPRDCRHPAYDPSGDYEPEVFGQSSDPYPDPVEIHRGVSIGTYKVDLLLEEDRWRRLVVECDGHDFHDRTKQQAAYDRARDRELLMLGFVTIRFTGSEIHHSPERCARETYACLLALHDVSHHAELAWRGGYDRGLTRAQEDSAK